MKPGDLSSELDLKPIIKTLTNGYDFSVRPTLSLIIITTKRDMTVF